MEESRGKRKKGILRKTWERCKSFGHSQNIQRLEISETTPLSPTPSSNNYNGGIMVKSKSWSSTSLTSSPIPHGFFCVHVGENKERFVIKVKCTRHPLFRRLLEEAELEYGFHNDGPLLLPCHVDVFIRVMVEINDGDDISQLRCSFARTPHSYYHLSSPSLVSFNHFS